MNGGEIMNSDRLCRDNEINKMLELHGYFHDWYVTSVYMANTGEHIVRYSHPGLTTIQIVLATSNNDISHTLAFVDVNEFSICGIQDPYAYDKHYVFNGFQRVHDFLI